MMKRILLTLAAWIWRRYGEHGIPTAVLIAARQLTAQWKDSDASGEYKRHQVYAALLKRYPQESKRVLGRAIEEVLR